MGKMRNTALGLLFLTLLGFACNPSNEGYLEETFIMENEVLSESEYEKYILPDEISNMNPADSAVFLNELRACSINKSRLLKSLSSGSKKFVHVIDKNNQGSASLFGLGNIELGKKEKITIVDYVQYLDTICTIGTNPHQFRDIRLAAGVRLFLKIKKVNKRVSIDIPSKIAAATEFGLAEATFSIETIGFANEDTREILRNLGQDFDVESYVKIMSAVSEILGIMKDSTVVKPVEVIIKK